MFTAVSEIFTYLDDESVKFIDVRFCDLLGAQHHFTIPASEFQERMLSDGIMFDGSSIDGFVSIHESDMKLIPDLGSVYIDPFRTAKTLVITFSVVDPFTNESFSRDPRQVAERAEAYLRSSGIADTCFVGAEAEFHIFESVRYQINPENTFYSVDSYSAHWNAGGADVGGNLGYKIPRQGGYSPVSPRDADGDLRDKICDLLQSAGLNVERAHHEVGSAGQQEINYRYSALTHAADDLLKFKYVVKNAAREEGRTATFMPKPIFGEAGSGMHLHFSLWRDGEPLFFDERGYGSLSDTARWFIGGLLAHAPALLAFTNPSLNSYRRLVPGFEAPVNLVYSARNRSACIRIPVTGTSPAAKRIEYRVPDPSANPYLAFAACLMAGLDGIRNRIEPQTPIDKDLYELPPEEFADIRKLPTGLEEALKELREDHDFLLAGDVFSTDLIDTWINLKDRREVTPQRIYPHPLEFQLYYDV